MKKLICAVAMLMIAGLAGPAFAGNVEDSNNKISIGFFFGASNQSGVFSVLGAGDAHGTAEVLSRAPYTGEDGSSRVRINKLLHFANGDDVYLSTDGTFSPLPLTIESSGTWILTGGTGMYMNVSGEGDYHWCRVRATGNLTGAYSGKMKLEEP